MSKLTETEIEKHLQNLPGWNFKDNAIHTEFEFKDFKDCFSVMSRIAFECEALNHHPDWANVYNTLNISLSTHDENGITLKDIELAKAIEDIIDEQE